MNRTCPPNLLPFQQKKGQTIADIDILSKVIEQTQQTTTAYMDNLRVADHRFGVPESVNGLDVDCLDQVLDSQFDPALYDQFAGDFVIYPDGPQDQNANWDELQQSHNFQLSNFNPNGNEFLGNSPSISNPAHTPTNLNFDLGPTNDQVPQLTVESELTPNELYEGVMNNYGFSDMIWRNGNVEDDDRSSVYTQDSDNSELSAILQEDNGLGYNGLHSANGLLAPPSASYGGRRSSTSSLSSLDHLAIGDIGNSAEDNKLLSSSVPSSSGYVHCETRDRPFPMLTSLRLEQVFKHHNHDIANDTRDSLSK